MLWKQNGDVITKYYFITKLCSWCDNAKKIIPHTGTIEIFFLHLCFILYLKHNSHLCDFLQLL